MNDTYLLVLLDKIEKNISEMRKINPQAMFCAVVKADAYGLGASIVGKDIEDLVDYYAVAKFSEGIELRKAGVKKPILILGYVPLDKVNSCLENQLEIVVYDLDYSKKINNELKGKLKVHIAIDTGQGRLGFRPFEEEKIKKLKNLEKLEVISICSHFSTADEEDTSFTQKQYRDFEKLVEDLRPTFDFEFVHMANDAGAIKHKITKDMVRSGISMYGFYPSDLLKEEGEIELNQACYLLSEVSFVKTVDKGTSIGYGRTFIADKKIQVATVPIGYADGFPRAFSNLGEVSIKGRPCKILGRVCMDQIMVDATGLDVKIGDEVLIYPDFYKEAGKIGTIVYELISSLMPRVPRVYVKNGEIVKVVNRIGGGDEDKKR